MTDFERRKLLHLPLPVNYKTDYCVVWLKIDYVERLKWNRFFYYPIFKRIIQKIDSERIQEFLDKLEIPCKATVFYFNSKIELKRQVHDLCGYLYYVRGK